MKVSMGYMTLFLGHWQTGVEYPPLSLHISTVKLTVLTIGFY